MLVVSENFLGVSGIQNRQGCTVHGNLIEFVGEATSGVGTEMRVRTRFGP